MAVGTNGVSTNGRGPFSWAATAWGDDPLHGAGPDEQRRARERASGARPEVASKRSLVAVSHAIERALLAGPVETPTVVVALFQRLPYFERERAVYQRMADDGVDVVIAFAEGEEFETPPGTHRVVLEPDEPLVDEWSVVALGPRAGAFLVATDRHEFDPQERELEAGRRFTGRWGYARTQAASELARLRLALGSRLPDDLVRRIDGLLARTMPTGAEAATSSGTPGETWATTSLHQLVDRMQTARAGNRRLREQLADAHEAMAARAGASVDPHSGLTNPDFLHRWSSTGGTTALPIGLGLFDVAEFDAAHERYDARAAYHAARRVATALTEPLGPVDAAVRLSEREFLVVLPGASQRHLAAVCDDIGEQLELASEGYPNIPLRARTATVVTRSRPLPLGDLHEALFRLDPDQLGPVDAGWTPAGDRMTVASTRSGRRPAHAWIDDSATTAPRSLEAGPLDVDPLEAGPLDADPLGHEPLDADPLGHGPLAADPLDPSLDPAPTDRGDTDRALRPSPGGRALAELGAVRNGSGPNGAAPDDAAAPEDAAAVTSGPEHADRAPSDPELHDSEPSDAASAAPVSSDAVSSEAAPSDTASSDGDAAEAARGGGETSAEDRPAARPTRGPSSPADRRSHPGLSLLTERPRPRPGRRLRPGSGS